MSYTFLSLVSQVEAGGVPGAVGRRRGQSQRGQSSEARGAAVQGCVRVPRGEAHPAGRQRTGQTGRAARHHGAQR